MSNLTPFRYAGSKNKLSKIILEYLALSLAQASAFAEPFVGGGSILLAIAEKYPTLPLLANDKDHWVASFWKVISSSEETEISQLLSLLENKPTISLFNHLREECPANDIEAAYRAIFFNRTCFSGILDSGPIGGQEQKSKYTIDCRYNFSALKKKIEKCHALLKNRTQVLNMDALQFMQKLENQPVIYLDPPYFVKGNGLYREKMNEGAHQELASFLQRTKNWLLSYDDCPEIKKLYQANRIETLAARYCIDGKKENWKNKNELFIFPQEESIQ